LVLEDVVNVDVAIASAPRVVGEGFVDAFPIPYLQLCI
jgi:hypothetical protein